VCLSECRRVYRRLDKKSILYYSVYCENSVVKSVYNDNMTYVSMYEVGFSKNEEKYWPL
jgi:hypothetical protein